MSIRKYLSQALSAICIGLISGCAAASQDDGYARDTYGGASIALGVPMLNVTPWKGGDTDGKVGYALTVKGPQVGTANLPGTPKCSTGITANPQIASGQLPPGLTMDSSSGDITGTPTERGHWIVTLKLNHVMCNGHHFNVMGLSDVAIADLKLQSFTSDSDDNCIEDGRGYCNLTTVRFHITGTGQVVQ